jgi:hypothetical protein
MLTLLIAATAFAASPVARPIAELPDPGPPAQSTVTAEVPRAPDATEDIRALLRARHTGDLPDRSTLDAHDGSEIALRWLALHGETLVEAERAAGLLALYPSEGSRAVCVALLESGAHAKARAGAARCLGTQQGERVEPALLGALTDPDIRVAMAVAGALKRHPGAVEAIDPAVRTSLPDEVRILLE